jgi:predicted hotdog family 3-hydroxylacyl-ACP dehydratase
VNNEIEALIPHKGSMCLLDNVISVSAENIVCQTRSHQRNDNPLLANDILAPVVLVEYAAQAAALHQPWLAREQGGDQTADKGYLAALRNVKYGSQANIAALQDTLTVTAEKLMHSADGLIYQFQVSAAEELLASGRFVIATGVESAS